MGIYDREYYRGETRGSGWFSGTAPVCRTLILVNVIVFLLTQTDALDPGLVNDWLSASSFEIFRQGRVWQLLTATFLHGSVLHLVGNMIFLWFVGRELESMYGTADFLTLYLSAAVVSTLGWALFDWFTPHHSRMVGASGAVFAVVVLFALYFPRREVLFMFIIPVEVWLLVAGIIAYQFILLLRGGDWHTAIESHLCGAAYGYAFKKFDLRWSRMPWKRAYRPRLRVVAPEPRDVAAPRQTGPVWSGDRASAAKPAATAVLPEEQLDARLDEVLAKIAREGRGGLTDDENKVLQEASLRARNRRDTRP